LLTNPERVEFRPFLFTVLSRIRRQWFLSSVEERDAGSYGETVLRFSVDSSGRISEWEVVRSSSSAYLDQIAAAGIQRAAPFPPLPSGFGQSRVRLQVTFSYMVRRG
jgi:TonB family protein